MNLSFLVLNGSLDHSKSPLLLSFSDDNNVITFTTFSPINNGTYHCVASNSQGSTPSQNIVYRFGGKTTSTVNYTNFYFLKLRLLIAVP